MALDEEMRCRKQLAAVSFSNLWRLWSHKNNKINTERRLRLCDAYITPILTYNACTWALTEAELSELEAWRRRHLRRIIGIYYPRKISNDDLYRKMQYNGARTYHTKCEMAHVWSHIAHERRHTSKKRATLHYFDHIANGFQGKPRHTLPLVIDKDLKPAAGKPEQHQVHALGLPSQLKSIGDLRQLETLATVRTKWDTIVKWSNEYAEPPKPTKRCLRSRGDAKRQ